MSIEIVYSVAGVEFRNLDNAQVFRLAVQHRTGYAPDADAPFIEQARAALEVLDEYRNRYNVGREEKPDVILSAKRAADAEANANRKVPFKKVPRRPEGRCKWNRATGIKHLQAEGSLTGLPSLYPRVTTFGYSKKFWKKLPRRFPLDF